MNLLFHKIRVAHPEPPILTDDEVAKLDAWLRTHSPSFREKYSAWKARIAGRPTPHFDSLLDWHRHLRFVLTFNLGRRVLLARPQQGADDKPDGRGYVRVPADPAAYVPAIDILTKHTPDDLTVSINRLVEIVEDFSSNRVRWTRPLTKSGSPARNRRSVHLGDWLVFLGRVHPEAKDGFPRLTAEEIAHRAAAVRAKRFAE